MRIFINQKVNCCVQSCHFVIQSHTKIPSNLSQILVSLILEISTFLCQVDVVDGPFLWQSLDFRNVALNFRCIQTFEGRLNIQFGNRIIKKPETFPSMRPHSDFRQLISPSSSVNEPINLLILDSLDNLITSRMVNLQRLGIIYHIGKNHIFLSFIKFIDSFNRSYILLVFRADPSRLQFRPENDPTDVYDDTDDINCNPCTCILHDIYVNLASPDYDISHPCVNPSE